MLQDRATPHESYERFISEALAGEKVYGLQDADGAWAVCSSQRDERADVIVLWSSRAQAARHAKEEWSAYKVVEIGLEAFVGVWLRGMHEDGSRVGPNWDADLNGVEVDAVDVAQRLTEAEEA